MSASTSVHAVLKQVFHRVVDKSLYDLERQDEVTPQPPRFQRLELKVPQPHFIIQIFHAWYHLRYPSLNSFQQIYVPGKKWRPRTNGILKPRSNQGLVEVQDDIIIPIYKRSSDPADNSMAIPRHDIALMRMVHARGDHGSKVPVTLH